MGNACVTTSQSNCLARLKQEFKQVKNRIQVLRSKIEILNRKEMVHDAYIKNSELSGLQEQEKQLANAIALVTKIQQQQASLQRQEFVLTSLNTAQKEILRLDLKNINLNHLLLDQQKIEEALKKMEDTLSSFNDGMGMQAPKSGEGNQEQSFLNKISTAFNRFEEVIQSLKRQLATQEERSNHLNNLFENEKKEKKDKIKMYKIQIENIHENQLKTAKQQIHDLGKQLDDNIQESKTIIDELKKQNKNLQDQNSKLTMEKIGLANQISKLQIDLQSNQQSLSQKNIECDSLKNKIQDLEKERINSENKYEQLNDQHNLSKGQLYELEKKSQQLYNECNIQKSQLRQFEKNTQELQNLLEKERNSSYNTIQSLQNEKNSYENQIAQLQCKVDHNQEEISSINQQLEEKNKRLERTIKDNKKEIEKLNLELRQLNEEINDIKKQMLIERQKCENKEKEIAQLKNGKAKLQNENHDLKMSLNLLSKEDRNFDQSYETQKSRDQSPFLQQGSNLKKSRNNSASSLQNQSQYNNKNPQNRSQRK